MIFAYIKKYRLFLCLFESHNLGRLFSFRNIYFRVPLVILVLVWRRGERQPPFLSHNAKLKQVMKEKMNEALRLEVNGDSAVQFNKNNSGCDTFTFSVIGDKHDYLKTIETLLKYIGTTEDEFSLRNDRYFITNLLIGMLPDHSQIISYEDAILLERIKSKKGGVL